MQKTQPEPSSSRKRSSSAIKNTVGQDEKLTKKSKVIKVPINTSDNIESHDIIDDNSELTEIQKLKVEIKELRQSYQKKIQNISQDLQREKAENQKLQNLYRQSQEQCHELTDKLQRISHHNMGISRIINNEEINRDSKTIFTNDNEIYVNRFQPGSSQ